MSGCNGGIVGVLLLRARCWLARLSCGGVDFLMSKAAREAEVPLRGMDEGMVASGFDARDWERLFFGSPQESLLSYDKLAEGFDNGARDRFETPMARWAWAFEMTPSDRFFAWRQGGYASMWSVFDGGFANAKRMTPGIDGSRVLDRKMRIASNFWWDPAPGDIGLGDGDLRLALLESAAKVSMVPRWPFYCHVKYPNALRLALEGTLKGAGENAKVAAAGLLCDGDGGLCGRLVASMAFSMLAGAGMLAGANALALALQTGVQTPLGMALAAVFVLCGLPFGTMAMTGPVFWVGRTVPLHTSFLMGVFGGAGHKGRVDDETAKRRSRLLELENEEDTRALMALSALQGGMGLTLERACSLVEMAMLSTSETVQREEALRLLAEGRSAGESSDLDSWLPSAGEAPSGEKAKAKEGTGSV